MRHGHVVPVDLVVMHVLLLAGIEVRDELVAEEIEVHPFVAAAAFRAAEQLAVEIARGATDREPGSRDETVAASSYYLAHHSSRARTARSG